MVSEQDKELCLLVVSGALDHPRRDFSKLTADIRARASRMLGLPLARRTYYGNASPDEQQAAKKSPQLQRSRRMVWARNHHDVTFEKLFVDAAVGWGAREVLASVLVTGSA